jgi:hypothetical protein
MSLSKNQHDDYVQRGEVIQQRVAAALAELEDAKIRQDAWIFAALDEGIGITEVARVQRIAAPTAYRAAERGRKRDREALDAAYAAEGQLPGQTSIDDVVQPAAVASPTPAARGRKAGRPGKRTDFSHLGEYPALAGSSDAHLRRIVQDDPEGDSRRVAALAELARRAEERR